MAKDTSKVRAILDAVKAAGRQALTAPEDRQVGEAYGIAISQEGLATSAARRRAANSPPGRASRSS